MLDRGLHNLHNGWPPGSRSPGRRRRRKSFCCHLRILLPPRGVRGSDGGRGRASNLGRTHPLCRPAANVSCAQGHVRGYQVPPGPEEYLVADILHAMLDRGLHNVHNGWPPGSRSPGICAADKLSNCEEDEIEGEKGRKARTGSRGWGTTQEKRGKESERAAGRRCVGRRGRRRAKEEDEGMNRCHWHR